MKFKEYYHISFSELNEEIDKDNIVSLGTIPLFESPILHEVAYFDKLNDIKTNHPFALETIQVDKFIENVIVDNISYKLYRKTFHDQVMDFFISGEKDHEQISAFVKYTPRGEVMEINGLWQINFILGLVKGVIDNYYSKHYSILQSDSIANNKGKKFFQNLAKSFLQKGKKVTVSIKGNEVPYEIEKAESYWKNSLGVHPAEKIILYTF